MTPVPNCERTGPFLFLITVELKSRPLYNNCERGGVMGKFFLLYFILAILGNPIVALIVVLVIFLLLDRRYTRWFPRVVRKVKNGQKLRQLLKELEANPHNVTDKLEQVVR